MESVAQGYCGFAGSDPTWSPAVNLYETAHSYQVCVDLAGVDKRLLDVSVRPAQPDGEGVRLMIRGDRGVPCSPVSSVAAGPGASAARSRIHRMEIDHGPFVREVELPSDVDHESISATYRAGLLWVELPKRR